MRVVDDNPSPSIRIAENGAVLTTAQLAREFGKVAQLKTEVERRQLLIGRSAQRLAAALAQLMEPGWSFYRVGVGLHAFEVDGKIHTALAYLEQHGEEYRYRYAVLSGGRAAREALRFAALDPSDSDPPGADRSIRLATYEDYQDFIDRLPKFLRDVTWQYETRVERIDRERAKIRAGQLGIRRVAGTVLRDR